MTPEDHLAKAIEHIQAAQEDCPEPLRDDELLIRAASEVGAARAYISAAREAAGEDDGE